MKSLLVRTISGIVFLAIMLGALLWSPIPFGAVFTFIVVVMMWEYLHISLGKTHILGQIFSICTGALLFLGVYFIKGFGLDPRFLLFLTLPIAGIFISILFEKEDGTYHNYPYLLGAILYIALPFTLTNFIAFTPDGSFNGLIILSLMIILWSSDVGAYIFGMTFGQKHGHKLFPSISPKKSWEGYWGSLFTSLLAGYLLSKFSLLPTGLVHALIIALIINILGTLGDLAESQLKRHFSVKDAGKIMPGHGGLLDRFDGAILSFPVAIAYIMFFELI